MMADVCVCEQAHAVQAKVQKEPGDSPPCDLHGAPVFICMYFLGVCEGHTLWMCMAMHF